MTTSTNSDNPAPGHRLVIPAIVWVLVVLANLGLNQVPELERNILGMLQAVSVALGFLLTLFWFFFLGRFRGRTRLLGLALLVANGWGASRSVRVDGTADGTGRPNWVWVWSTPVKQIPVSTDPADVAASPVVVREGLPSVPQFFGAERDGKVLGASLDPDWTSHPPRMIWRQAVGSGWSSFSSVGGRLFTHEQVGPEEMVTCRHLPTGTLLWSARKATRFFQWQGGEGPRDTPTWSAGRVFARGGTGMLTCVNAITGTEIWSRPVLEENHLPNLIWGVSDSPLVVGTAVIVNGGDTNGPSLLAFDRDTGRPLWRAGSDKASYASPSVGTLLGKQVILSVNAASFTVHDLADGRVLVDYPWANDKWPKASQPVLVGGDRVFLSAGYGVGCVMLQIAAAPGTTTGWTASEVWKSKTMKTQFNSAAYLDGFLYGLDDGFLACVDAKTGQRRWKDGRYGSGQSLLVDNFVVIQNESGSVHLAQASPESFKEFGKIPALDSKTWNHPAVVGRYLVVRNDHEAACYELPVLASSK